MSTTLFNAGPYDPTKDRRRRNLLIGMTVAIVVIGALLWTFRYWPYEHKADQFFTALQSKDYDRAYGLWMSDLDWKSHPDNHKQYPYSEFMTDWGPSGEWGVINSHKVDTAVAPKGSTSGVIVQITVNGRLEKACIWVEKRDKSITFPPVKTIDCR